MARRERSLKVEVPEPGRDKPELGRVGVIAAAGFAIGVVWPWLAGVHLVPSPPSDEAPEAPAAASAAVAAGSATPPSTPDAPSAPLAAVAPALTDVETVKVSALQITGCRDGKKKLKDCDRIAIDERLRAPLATLATCDAGRGATDTLSVGIEIDFESKSIAETFAGKSTTFDKEKARLLVDCAKASLSGVNVDGIDHEHARYTVFYFVEFVPPGSAVTPGAAPAEETAAASGLATVSWDVAVVRDQPDDGKIVTRLRFGTRVAVTARRGKWYEVRYDGKGSKGWVHRNALGL